MKFSILILFLCISYCVQGSQLLGGWNDASESEEGVQKATTHAAKIANDRTNSLFHTKLVQIISAKKKIVSGVLYRVVFEMKATTCKKNDVQVLEINDCEFDDKSTSEVCTAELWSQPWLREHPTVQKLECKTQESKEKNAVSLKFQDFAKRYNKTYVSEAERAKRFKIFSQNLKVIKLLNDHEQGTGKYGVTHFSDLTSKEFQKRFLGLRPGLKVAKTTGHVDSVPRADPLPDSFDWRDHNVVSEVKNQGTCGSCWAFSVTGNVEGQWALKKKQLLSLSEQELVDCDKLDQGCNGGEMTNAYQEIMKLGGLEDEKDYPYEGEDDKCAFKQTSVRAYINGSLTLPTDETAMASWLVQNGPISIGINANAMQFYFGGISHPPNFLCSPKNLDHGVLIVGYGTHTYPIFHKKIPFWIVKNSWGKNWGEQGYYRVYRGGGTCGLNLMATSSVVA